MTIDELAVSAQREFTAIHGEIAEVKSEMATKADLAELKFDVKADLESAKTFIVDEIKTFMYPHLRSLDTVLVDVEHLKGRVEKIEQRLGSPGS